MEATLVFNARAGGSKRVSAERLVRMLEASGFSPVYRHTEDEAELDEVLALERGLVVAAGGDGTVQAVAKRLLGSTRPLAVLPLGTANNIARTLGLPSDPEVILKGLRAPRVERIDVGRVRSPWGEDIFLEALGVGLFAELLDVYDPELGKSVARALDTLREVALDYQPKRYRLKLDGLEMSGTYVAIEVMNTKATGPRLNLAPEADPSDGLFDIVCVLEPDKATLAEYALKLVRGALSSMANVQTLRGKRLEFFWQGSPLHIDAEAHPNADERSGAERALETGGGLIEVELLPGALELWLPTLKG